MINPYSIITLMNCFKQNLHMESCPAVSRNPCFGFSSIQMVDTGTDLGFLFFETSQLEKYSCPPLNEEGEVFIELLKAKILM